ncbi:MAG: DUF1269 domain-containing protein, partial [bacterium]|nr:DUF1269 domain-containing protein [Candidatus Kapabacteria bacterium]
VGALVGGLIGLVGGPVGVAVGFGGGAMLGAMRDVVNLGISDDFLEKVSVSLAPGTFAVISEVAEEWVTPLDIRIEAIGGSVMREFRGDFVDDQIERNISNLKSDVERRREEHAQARAEKKLDKLETKLVSSLKSAEERLQYDAAEGRTRMLRVREEIKGKIAKLQAQASAPAVSREAQVRIENRIAELRNDLGQREQKLEHAFELTSEALSA